MKKVSFNFENFEFKNLDGEVVSTGKELKKQLGNAIYLQAQTLDLSRLGEAIHDGGEQEATEEQVNELIAFFAQADTPGSQVSIFIPALNSQLANWFKALLPTPKGE